MEDDLLLKGFGFSGYRSFGNELAKIAPLKKINLIIGQNNVGKSNIIKFLHEQYSRFESPVESVEEKLSDFFPPQINKQNIKSPFLDLDFHISNKKISYKIAFPLLEDDIDEHINHILKNKIDKHKCFSIVQESPISVQELAKIVLQSIFAENKCVWFIYSSNLPTEYFKINIDDLKKNSDLWESLDALCYHHISPTHEIEDWIADIMSILSPYNPNPIKVEVIPAIRKIGQAGSEIEGFGGEGIIERLAQIQNPARDNYESDKQKFITINQFVKNVLENPSAEIEIPHKRDMILVHMDGKTLPLESLGTGVHEVIILASASTILEKTIVCIEEPELHLHPLLQKKLVRYLSENTNNQYFFTTHSAHLLDAVEASIFHVTLENGVSKVEYISSTEQKSNICNDLGYKASDLLQANCIIWVEGPSDRIYLNYWLENYCRQNKMRILIEGIDYSIMFYGGRLFSHLTALDEDEKTEKIEDFISLKSLNRNAVIMFDSDKDKEEAELNSTKQRLKDEFDKGSGFAWVTEGREVENYLEADKVEEAVLQIHSKIGNELISKDKWSNILKFKRKDNNKEETADKVKVAKYYIKLKEKEKSEPNFDILDLKERLKDLIDFILKSNGY